MKIVKFSDEGGEEILRKLSMPLDEHDFGPQLNKQVEDMFKVLGETEHGIALASPQVGIHLRLFVMYQNDKKKVIINPEILKMKGDFNYNEGCLSFPSEYKKRKRYKQVRLKYQDLDGNWHRELFRSLDAFVVQHEIDHLDGKLFIDEE